MAIGAYLVLPVEVKELTLTKLCVVSPISAFIMDIKFP
jgi:hypothetical protein